MANEIFRVGKVSSIDYAAGLVRVVYPDKDNSVTAPLPHALHRVQHAKGGGSRSWCCTYPTGPRRGWSWGRYWSGNNKPPEGAEGLFRKDLGRSPGEAMIRYDGSTLTIQCAGAIHIEAGGAVTINGATIDLN